MPKLLFIALLAGSLFWCAGERLPGQPARPNIIVILTDDHRWDALGAAGNSFIQTPALDSLAARGLYFPNAFVTLSICAPSRAAVLTGRYGSANGVMDMHSALRDDEQTLADHLGAAGYRTAVFGKWHLPNTPRSLGFQHEYYFNGLVPYWNVNFIENGRPVATEGFVEDVSVRAAIRYLEEHRSHPFFMFFNTFAPHMDVNFQWPAKAETLARYEAAEAPVPATWQEDYTGKPPYIREGRPHQRALFYGYDRADSIRAHVTRYTAAATDMDRALGELFRAVRDLGLADNTYIMLMGDNGWFMGEHGLTSKVLAYEESIRVPFLIAGPGIRRAVAENLILNIDILPTALGLAGLSIPAGIQGKSLVPLLKKGSGVPWRDHIFYEAPHPEHGSFPHYAIRTHEWKYIATYDTARLDSLVFEELYYLREDRNETNNLAGLPDYEEVTEVLRGMLREEQAEKRSQKR